MSLEPSSPIERFPLDSDCLGEAARRLVEIHHASLPDLAHVVVILPDLAAAGHFRRALLGVLQLNGHRAAVGPQIDTLRHWITQHTPVDRPVLSDEARELRFLELLQPHSHHFGESDPWHVAPSLLALFDELALTETALSENREVFTTRLREAYGIGDRAPDQLDREAALVFTLWQAWRDEMHASRQLDSALAYAQRLRHASSAAPRQEFWLVDPREYAALELQWLQQQRAANCLRIFVRDPAQWRQDDAQPPPPPASPRGRFIHTLLHSADADLRERARTLRERMPHSPLLQHVAVHGATDAEGEAAAVDLQIRRWLLDNVRSIAIVTEDRRLARRLRALLERGGIALQDRVGWALSTSSAATVLERWLQCVEQEFDHQPLLDLLKSPLLTRCLPVQDLQAAVFRFERDIVLHENIARSARRYHRALDRRARRLGWSSAASQDIRRLLHHLEEAAAPLQSLLDGAWPMEELVNGLTESLRQLGVIKSMHEDPVGEQLLEHLDRIQAASLGQGLRMRWSEFRAWLGRRIERATFRPQAAPSGVQLLTLESAASVSFDAAILCGAERDLIPGDAPGDPYFNQGVRAQMHLSTWRERKQRLLQDFERLFYNAERLLITHRREHDAEPVLVSPWVEALQALHGLAYDTALLDPTLEATLQDGQSEVRPAHMKALPSPVTYPRPHLPGDLASQSLSAAGHQRLIDCPYQFFVSDGLGLQAPDEIRELLAKADYGERIHRCLEAFHGGVDSLPGPFEYPLDPAHRAQAIDLLERIARAQFARDVEDNFVHRTWLVRWLRTLPAYVDWQIARTGQWQVAQVEYRGESAVTARWSVRGRLDRIDVAEDQFAVLDYKSGRIPSQQEVIAGEQVQLPTYSMLHPRVVRAEYLDLQPGAVKTRVCLQGEELEGLLDDTRVRLRSLLEAVDHDAPLPAWGDDHTCHFCAFGGICRRQAWAPPLPRDEHTD